MSIGYWADPYLLPGRGDDQQLATLNLFRREAVAGLVEIDESLTGAPPGPARIAR
jgi:hypothetical protein